MISYPNYSMNRPFYTGNQYRIRPVSSIEEVKASPIDFDGSLFYFHDVINHKIYTKQINLDGMVQIEEYSIQIEQPMEIVDVPEKDYITREEFQEAMQKLGGKKKHESTRNDN